MMSTSLSGSRSSISMSKQSMPANFLNRTALPSMTGLAASGPIAPRPSTAVPLVTTPTRLPRAVRLRASAGIADDLVARCRHARGVGEREVALVGELLGRLDRDLSRRELPVILERGGANFPCPAWEAPGGMGECHDSKPAQGVCRRGLRVDARKGSRGASAIIALDFPLPGGASVRPDPNAAVPRLGPEPDLSCWKRRNSPRVVVFRDFSPGVSFRVDAGRGPGRDGRATARARPRSCACSPACPPPSPARSAGRAAGSGLSTPRSARRSPSRGHLPSLKDELTAEENLASLVALEGAAAVAAGHRRRARQRRAVAPAGASRRVCFRRASAGASGSRDCRSFRARCGSWTSRWPRSTPPAPNSWRAFWRGHLAKGGSSPWRRRTRRSALRVARVGARRSALTRMTPAAAALAP